MRARSHNLLLLLPRQMLAILVVFVMPWTGLAVETLEDAWRVALANNDGLAVMRYESDAACYEAQAAAAKLSPTASVRTGYRFRSKAPAFQGSQPALGYSSFQLPYAQQQAANFSVKATVPIWTGGRIENSVASACSAHKASVEASRWGEMQLLMAVAEAYVAVLQSQAACTAATQILQSAESQQLDTIERARQRRATDRHVLASRVAVMEARQRVVSTCNHRLNAIAAYNQLLGRPLSHHAAVDEPFAPPIQGSSLEDLTQTAMAARPDIHEIRRSIRVHEHDAAGWRAAAKPQVSAEVAYDFEENRYQSPEGLATAGVVVDWNVLDAGKRRRLSAASAKQAASMRAALRERQSQVALEVLHAWNGRSEAISAEHVATDALALAVEHERSVAQRAAQGLAVSADALAAKAALVEARALTVYARTNRVLAHVRLQFAAGKLPLP